MTTIAELGIRVDSGDATQAATDLDRLAEAGKRSEESAGRTGRAWESALAGMQGDTRQIVVELQQLNAKQAQLAQQMITVGRAVNTASTAFSGAAANMTAMRTGAEKAGQAQTVLSTANDVAAQSARRSAEGVEQQQARLLGMAKASLEASGYVQSLNRATQQSVEVTRQANTVLSDRVSQQAAIASRAQAILASEDKLAAASKVTTAAQRDEGKALSELLGKIDPTVAALGRLDDMERKLQGYRTSGALDAETFGEYKTKLDQVRTALGGVDVALGKTGVSAKQTAAAMRMLPAQFSDVVVSLQAGQSPLTVLLQQGAQVKDSFGGAGAAARAMGGYVAGLVTPVNAAAAAVGVLAVAAYQAGREQDAFNQAVILTGNYAGTSGAKLTDLAKQISATVGTTGAAASTLAQIAGAGDLAGESFKIVATTALEMEKATGRAVDETLADFRKIADDPVKAAEELNRRYHWLTASTLEQVRALVDQGEKTEAVRVVTEQFGETMTRRAQLIREEMSGLPKLFNDIGDAAAKMWDGIKGVWRDPTLDKVADGLRLQISSMENIRKDFRNEGNYDPKKLKAWRARLAAIEGLSKPATGVVSAQGQSDNDKLNALLDRAAPKAEKLADRMKEIDRLVASSRKEGFTVTDEQVEQLRAKARKDFKETKTPTTPVNLTDVKDSRNALSMILSDYRGYERELSAIQKSGVISQEAVYAQRVSLAKRQRADVTSAYTEEIQALEEAKGLASTTGGQRIQLDQRIAKARSEMVRAQREADSELTVLATNEQGRLAKQARAVQTYTDALDQQVRALQLQGQRAADGLGLGDRQRGLLDQQNGITDRTNQQRLDLANQYGDGSRGMSLDEYNQKLAALAKTEQDLQRTTVSNYDRMTTAQGDWRNGASSAFQNYLEQARDVAGQTRALFTNAFTSMEDAVVNFAMTGKLSFSDFTKSIIADMARIATQQAASSLLSSFATSALGGWLGGAGAATGAAGAAGGGGFDFGLGGASAGMTYRPGGYSSGGYTGDGGKYEPAGIVHGGEFVLRREVVGQPGMRDYLETLNTRGYADGGYVDSITTQPIPRQTAVGGNSFPVSVSVSAGGEGGTASGVTSAEAAESGKRIQQAVKYEVETAIAKSLRHGGAIWRAVNGR
ncbi:phage tail tape measure protein [Pseudomonas monteilii]